MAIPNDVAALLIGLQLHEHLAEVEAEYVELEHTIDEQLGRLGAVNGAEAVVGLAELRRQLDRVRAIVAEADKVARIE